MYPDILNKTIEEVLDKAVSLGWEEIGISDHLIIHKDMKQSPFYDLILKTNIFHTFIIVLSKGRNLIGLLK